MQVYDKCTTKRDLQKVVQQSHHAQKLRQSSNKTYDTSLSVIRQRLARMQ